MSSQTESIQTQLKKLAENASGFLPDTALYQYIAWLNEQLENREEKFEKEYWPIIEREACISGQKAPFLSVITRTQGKRPEMLRETLLSLGGQSDGDFELILIGHKLDEDKKLLVQKILDEQPQSFREKIRFIALDHGTRTTPLNMGFAYARGSYAAVLDDDDVVLDNWVESFHQAAQDKPGTIIHTYVLTQKWMTVDAAEGKTGLRASAAFGAECCIDFELLRQLDYNMCPLMGLAFPTYYFQKLGMIFDEKLTTTEDWDYFMRLSFLSGVADVDHPTSIYRLWENAQNSQTEHTRAEWDKNRDTIQEKYLNMPILIPAGSAKIYMVGTPAPAGCSAERAAIKEKIKKYIPKPIWNIAKKLYRFFGGKKWLG